MSPSLANIQRVQATIGATPDGFPGNLTWVAIRAFVDNHPELWETLADAMAALVPKVPATSVGGMLVTQAALDLILNAEGVDQPSKRPPLGSGITIGCGDDLQFRTADTFADDWGAYIPSTWIARLSVACGKSADWAAAHASDFSDITIGTEVAHTQFVTRILPEEAATTLKAFPGVSLLPAPAQGALLSLVYNRGADMADNPSDSQHARRAEMRTIRSLVADMHAPMQQRLLGIADALDSMCRLWIGTDATGLVTRRHAEANLVRSAIPTVDNSSNS